MSQEDQDRLYALMAMAEDTQRAAAEAVEGLRVERAAFAEQVEVQRALTAGLDEKLERFDAAVARLDGAEDRVAATAAATVHDTVTRTMQAEAAGRDEAAAAATHGAITAAVGEQAETLQVTTARTAATAEAVEERLRAAAATLGRRWMGTAAVGMIAAVAATTGIGQAIHWWLGDRIEVQRAMIERLAPEVERLERLDIELGQLAEASEAFIFGSCSAGSELLCVRVNESRRATNDPDAPAGSAVFVVWDGGPDR